MCSFLAAQPPPSRSTGGSPCPSPSRRLRRGGLPGTRRRTGRGKDRARNGPTPRRQRRRRRRQRAPHQRPAHPLHRVGRPQHRRRRPVADDAGPHRRGLQTRRTAPLCAVAAAGLQHRRQRGPVDAAAHSAVGAGESAHQGPALQAPRVLHACNAFTRCAHADVRADLTIRYGTVRPRITYSMMRVVAVCTSE